MPTTTIAPPVRAELMTLNDDELLKSVVDHYHQRFHESSHAGKFLESCGIANSEAAEQFQIGFVDRTLKQLLPSHQVKAGHDLRKRLKAIGLLKSSGHEVFRGCIVVPVFNEQRNVVQIYGRRIDNVPKGTDNELWLCNREAVQLPEEIKQLLTTLGRCRPPTDSSCRSEKKAPLPLVADTEPIAPNGSGSAVATSDAHTPPTPGVRRDSRHSDWDAVLSCSGTRKEHEFSADESQHLWSHAMTWCTWIRLICAKPGHVLRSSRRPPPNCSSTKPRSRKTSGNCYCSSNRCSRTSSKTRPTRNRRLSN